MRHEAQELVMPMVLHFEGEHLTSYVFPGETWATVGVGRAIAMKFHPMTITKEQSRKNLLEDLARKDAQLCKEIPPAVLAKLTDNQYAGVLSFRFNVKDSVWLHPACSTRKALVAGDIPLFCAKLKQWNKGEGNKVLAGLVRRRKCDRWLLKDKPMAELVKNGYFIHDYATDNL